METLNINNHYNPQTITKKIDTYEEFQKYYGNELEGTINNEPPKNKYRTIKYHKMNKFPYYLTGKIISTFKGSFTETKHFLNGVGILIGPQVILTVAHNLVYYNIDKLEQAKKVEFYPCSNGDFIPFNNIKSKCTYVPDEYINALRSGNREKQLANDWGLIFLNKNLGLYIMKLFDINNNNNCVDNNELKVNGNVYSFFTDESGYKTISSKCQESTDIHNNNNTIALVGYTEYKHNYKRNTSYKFLKSFIKDTSITDSHDHTNNTMNAYPISTVSDEINFNQVSIQMISFEVNQGKLTSELIQEGKDYVKHNKSTHDNTFQHNSSNQEIDKSNDTESLITSSNDYTLSSIKDNGIDYIILDLKEYNREFDSSDVNKLIMSESCGEMELSSDKESISYKISTYKGQSGSPVFLKYKNEKTNTYVYSFLGIHSRRGPSRGEILYEHGHSPNCTNSSSLATNENSYTSENNIFHIQNQDKQSLMDFIANNNVGKINGICDYNLAVAIYGNKKAKIIDKINNTLHQGVIQKTQKKKSNTNCNSKYYDYLNKQDVFTSFILVKLYENNQLKCQGVFKNTMKMDIIFSFASQISNIPTEFILLYEGDDILNYNYDSIKSIRTILKEEEMSTMNNNNMSLLTLHIGVKYKAYGEFLGEVILNKLFSQNEFNKPFTNDNPITKQIFSEIFKEIHFLRNNPLVYGKLFKKIRKHLMNKLGIQE